MLCILIFNRRLLALENNASASSALIEKDSFLHRIFPVGFYKDSAESIVKQRIFKPRKDCKEVPLLHVVDWEGEAYREDRNWRMQLQGWTMFHPIMNFFDDYEEKQDVLDYFFDLANSWYGRYGDDPDDITTSRMPESYSWYDMSVGFRALIIAFIKNRIDFFGLKVEPSEIELLNKLSRKHIANLSSQNTFSLNKHGIFQIHGLVSLIKVFPEMSSEEIFNYAIERMEELIGSQFDKNGMHVEHSPHYHFYVLSTFEAAIKTGWYQSSDGINKIIDAAGDAKKWIVDPLERPVCIGDSILTRQNNILYPPRESDYVTSDFNSSGYAVVRSGWHTPADDASMLFLTGAYHSKAHKHRDCLSFEWFEYGKKIICDGGKYGYRSDKYRHYFLSSRAHNSVEIEGFDILKIKPYGSAISRVSEEEGVYTLSAGLSYPAITHDRDLIYRPGSWLIVYDDLVFARSRKYTQWFHFEKNMKLIRLVGNSILFSDRETELFLDCLTSTVASKIFYGDDDEMQGYVSEKDYSYEPSYAVGFEADGKSDKVITVLSLSKNKRKEALEYAKKNVIKGAGVSSSIFQEVSSKKIKKNIIPNVPHVREEVINNIALDGGERTNEVTVNGAPINFYSNIKPGNKRAIFLLPGAVDRKKGSVAFQRYSWADSFEGCDVFSFSDPSIKDGNDLSIGWFQYSIENFGITALAELLKKIIELRKYKERDVCVFGSSAGGYVSIKLSEMIDNITCVAINPQIYLRKYTRRHFLEMLESCYSGMSEKDVLTRFPERISALPQKQKKGTKIYIFQNTEDEKHLVKHLKPFIESVGDEIVKVVDYCSLEKGHSDDKTINIAYYKDQASGHSPPGKSVTVEMIESAFFKERVWETLHK